MRSQMEYCLTGLLVVLINIAIATAAKYKCTGDGDFPDIEDCKKSFKCPKVGEEVDSVLCAAATPFFDAITKTVGECTKTITDETYCIPNCNGKAHAAVGPHYHVACANNIATYKVYKGKAPPSEAGTKDKDVFDNEFEGQAKKSKGYKAELYQSEFLKALNIWIYVYFGILFLMFVCICFFATTRESNAPPASHAKAQSKTTKAKVASLVPKKGPK